MTVSKMERFFISDIVALKADPSIIAMVCATSRDTDSLDPNVSADWVFHKEVDRRVFDRTLERRKPPEGLVVIGFATPSWGRTIVAESALTLLDRTAFVGDAVKRNLHDFESGTITKTRVQCRIQPIYTDLPYQGQESWPHKPEENELWVPSEDLRFEDYCPGDYVAYKGWIGEVIHIRQEVLVCLKNGSVVRVREPEELDAPWWRGDTPHVRRRHMDMSLVESIAAVKQKYETMTDSEAMARPPTFHVGQRVQTKKSNLRLGFWVYGSYSASIPAMGVIVQARVIEIDVEWVTTNYYDRNAAASPRPDNILTTDELDEVKLCTTQLPESPFGSRISREKMVGDVCRFQFDPDAEVKYPEGSANGFFRRIPRMMTKGYNMNTFSVVDSRTDVEVEWQDGSRTWQSSTAIVPYTVPDDHDLWPGEVVMIKDAVTESNGVMCINKVGIVQSVDAKDRTANVRWFIRPQVHCPADDLATLLPGSKCGPLSEEVSSLSLYELFGFSALARRRGDVVVVLPDQRDPPEPGSGNAPNSGIIGQIAARLRGAQPAEVQEAPQSAENGYLWIGEVVNVALDGKITVRLGAQQPPRDVELFIDDVDLLLSPDLDDDEGSFTDDEMAMSGVEEFSDGFFDSASVEPLEETIEYEGGTRLDDEGEDAWMTDSSGSDTSGDEEDGNAQDKPMNVSLDTAGDSGPSDKASSAKETSTTQQPVSVAPEPVEGLRDAQATQAEYRFNEYSTMPPQFLILDEPPPEGHHFYSHDHSWSSSGMLRRIRKEHKLLQSSLPRGIWVRTWADRLDLLRVLIIGPQGTPYALAPFVLDFAFGNGYPKTAPEAYFHSWTGRVGKINPNLYEDGMVCLSILGTWPESHDNEAWNAERSSMLQILVSLLGLVLVERPYYNEAGFEDMAGRDEALVNERIYSEKALVMSQGFVVHGLTHEVPGMTDVIRWVYQHPQGPRLLEWVVRDARKLRRGRADQVDGAGSDGDEGASAAGLVANTPQLSKGALMLLEKYLPPLEAMLNESETAK